MTISNPYMTESLFQAFAQNVVGYTFRPGSVPIALGDPRLEPWDCLEVTDVKGNVYIVPCLNIVHSFDGGLSTTITAPGNSESEDDLDVKGPVTQQIERMAYELLTAKEAIFKRVRTDELYAKIAEFGYITADEISGKMAEFGYVTADEIDAKVAELGYAKIDFSNIDTAEIDKAKVAEMFLEVGLITSATIVDGHVTGYLDSVEINAASITSGTIIADRLLLRGSEDGLLYQLNNLGEVTSTNVDTLDGSILTKRSVTADHIVAGTITSNEINVEELFAQDITASGTIRGVELITDRGDIGGFTIENNRLYSEYMSIYSSGYGTGELWGCIKIGGDASDVYTILGQEGLSFTTPSSETIYGSAAINSFGSFGVSVDGDILIETYSDAYEGGTATISAESTTVTGTLTTDGGIPNRGDRIHHSGGTLLIRAVLSSGYYYFRPNSDIDVVLGSTNYPWYNVHTKNFNLNGRTLNGGNLVHSGGQEVRLMSVDGGYSLRPYCGDTSEVTNANVLALGTTSVPFNRVYANKIFALDAGSSSSSTANARIVDTGQICKTASSSSRTIKHDIGELNDDDIAAERLYDVSVVQAKYNEDILSKEDCRYLKNLPMFIIEDLEEKYPVAVDKESPDSDVKTWTWNSQYLIPPILKLIQEQHKKDVQLEERIDTLQEMLAQAMITIAEQQIQINNATAV